MTKMELNKLFNIFIKYYIETDSDNIIESYPMLIKLVKNAGIKIENE